MKKKKKYSYGTGKNGVVRHYIESPDETITESQIMLAKAKEKAMSNGWAQGLDILGNMAVQYGTNMMTSGGGVPGGGKAAFGGNIQAGGGNGGKFGQGFGDWMGNNANTLASGISMLPMVAQMMGPGFAFGGMITDPPTGKKKKKVVDRDLTPEEIAAEVQNQNKKDAFDPNETVFTAEGINTLFGGQDIVETDIPALNLGKYGKVDYFSVDTDANGRYILNNTKNNPANYALYKEQLRNIKKLNPEAKFANEGFVPLINLNKKAYGGNVSEVEVEVEGEEVGELPNGQLIDFKGPSHENGGIDIELPEGTEIFSKRIKVKGKTMAERKKAREKKAMSLEKLFEKSGDTDLILKKTLERTKSNNAREEEEDKNLQQMVSHMKTLAALSQAQQYRAAKSNNPNAVMEELQNQIIPKGKPKLAAYGTGKGGLKKYADGTGPGGIKYGSPDPNNPQDPYGYMNDNDFLAKAQNFLALNKGGTGGTEDSVLPGEQGLKLPNFTAGDLTGIAGTLYSAFAPMSNTQKNRAGDTPNINAFEDFGNDALDSLDTAKTYVASQRDKALKDLETSRTRITKNNRNSARGVNTLRSLDLASEVNANRAEEDIYDTFSKQMMQLVSQEAGFENAQDQAVMAGEQARDLADRQDRDNYYTQLAQDIATKGEGIQQVGKMLNQNKRNTVAEQAVNDSSINFQYTNGTLTDKAGNVVMTSGEIAKSAKALGMTPEEYIEMINTKKNG